jgi:hypothetical protein
MQTEGNQTMSTKNRMVITTLVISATAAMAQADVVFSDDFESGLGLWTGKNGRAHSGVIVDDPFGGLNSVLSFKGLKAGGDMFTQNAFSLNSEQSYRISFDYLGLATERTRVGDSGGYVGFSVGTPSRHSWQWATGSVSGADDVLIDDGQWHSYEFDFTTADLGIGPDVRLMLEDFSGSRGVSGDAFFDNFAIAAVPTPGTAALLGIGGFVALRRRR